jgi:hypothetical protein
MRRRTECNRQQGKRKRTDSMSMLAVLFLFDGRLIDVSVTARLQVKVQQTLTIYAA